MAGETDEELSVIHAMLMRRKYLDYPEGAGDEQA